MTDRELINVAVAAAANSYSPYSNVKTGAALECADGAVYTGCTVENAALNATLCAERVVLCKAVSEGKREFRRLAIYSPETADYCAPCGLCRQALGEFSPELEVLCVRADGRYVSYRLRELLPLMLSKDRFQ